VTVIYSESVFPRANRDDCTRAHDPMQGPYRSRPWWHLSASDPADRIVMRACFVLAVVLMAMWCRGWL
jgi:hypothetical protein